MPDRTVFIHAHVFKSAGTTFLSILQKNFGFPGRDYPLLERIPGSQYTREEMERILRARPGLRYCSSHMISFNLPYDMPGVRIQAIAFVRDPVDQFLSHYFFHRTSMRGLHEPQAGEMDLDEYIDWALIRRNKPDLMARQTKFLSGWGEAAALAPIERLLREGRAHLFPTRRFDEACVLLERLFPNDFRDCSYTRENVSKWDQTVSDEQRQRIAPFAGADNQLHEMADTFLQDQLARHFPAPGDLEGTLAEFRERCAKEGERAAEVRRTRELYLRETLKNRLAAQQARGGA